MKTQRLAWFLLTAALLLTIQACSRVSPPALFGPTATLTGTATFTPEPTSTPTPTPTLTPTPMPSARLNIAERHLFNGDWEAAETEYQTALQNAAEPEVQSGALLGLGKVYFQTGDYPRALDHLRRIRREYPDSPFRPQAEFALAQTFTALQRYPEAIEAYQAYLEYRPELIDSYVHEFIGDLYRTDNQPDGALTSYQAALQAPRGGATTSLLLKLAAAYEATGDYATAIVLYDDLFQQNSGALLRAQLRFLTGRAYAALGQTEQAQENYLDAVNNYPTAYDSFSALVELVNAGYPVSELQRGLVDYHAGQYGVALAAFDRYLGSTFSTAEGAAQAHYYRGLTHRMREEYITALADWEIVIQNYPESEFWADAWEQKGYTQWAYLGDYASAVETFEAFTDQAPAHSRAAQFLDYAARVSERDGKLDNAARLWERLAIEYPGSTLRHHALFQAGLCYYRLGEYGFAQSSFKSALDASLDLSNRAADLLWIGKTHLALDNRPEAELAWQQAAAVDPTGYYSERAADLLAGRQPFATPIAYDLSYNRSAERAEAETWLRAIFSLPAEIDLSAPGTLAGDSRLLRLSELWRLGLYDLALSEIETLRTAVKDDPADTYRLALYLIDLGAYRQGILAARQVLNLAGMDDAATMTAPVFFNRLRFGAYFSDLVFTAAQEYRFHPLFLFSVMRQESLFEGFARSSAGARGLMQIIPSTGQALANQLGWPPDYTAEDLYRPVVSLRLGTEYLAQQRAAFDGDLYAALAAYNGGPGNAAIWKQLAPDDPDLFVEVVRFEETRRYIKLIYELYSIYYQLYDRSP